MIARRLPRHGPGPTTRRWPEHRRRPARIPTYDPDALAAGFARATSPLATTGSARGACSRTCARRRLARARHGHVHAMGPSATDPRCGWPPLGAYFATTSSARSRRPRHRALPTQPIPKGCRGRHGRGRGGGVAWRAGRERGAAVPRGVPAGRGRARPGGPRAQGIEKAAAMPVAGTPSRRRASGSGERESRRTRRPTRSACAACHLDDYAEALWPRRRGLATWTPPARSPVAWRRCPARERAWPAAWSRARALPPDSRRKVIDVNAETTACSAN